MPLNPAQIALLMARLPAASQQALEFLAKTKGKTPQEVFEEVDVSAALSTTKNVMYNFGFAFGRIRSIARAWQDRNDKE